MNEDREVLRELWDSQLPIKFELAKEEVSTVEVPQPVFLLVPRSSYFPICWDKAHKYLRQFIGNDEAAADMWLEFDGQPLKWHIPIGALYDLCVLSNSSTSADTLDDSACLPWCVTVHFRNYPRDEILPSPSIDAVKAHFMSMLKEADVTKHRNQTMGSMQEKDHKSLWAGLFHARFDQFWLVNRKLMEYEPNGGYRNIPFRLYDRDTRYIQKPMSSFDADGQPTTLQQLLDRFAHLKQSSDSTGRSSSFSAPDQPSVRRAVIHGVEVPPETPLQWLCVNFAYPDNFLHIILRTDEKQRNEAGLIEAPAPPVDADSGASK